ncbi:MAG TPA: FkbM family methyltransferase [Candidatus Limnocylindrales bacterium]|nr:FkbM family methyltransferase [Candidatus Limnocylindrales bacterium]
MTIPLDQGRKLRLTHIDDSYLPFELFWRGANYYEPITRRVLEALVQPGTTFIDVGAHIGFFSLIVGSSPAQPQVIAFEPNPQNVRSLVANLKANNLTNAVCESLAISDRDGIGTLYLTESDMSASLMKDFQAEDTRQIGSITVPTTTLDTYMEQRQMTGPMVIKVDMEGHEPAFFRGAVATLERYRPDILLEVLYNMDEELVAQLKSLGYNFYPITDKSFEEEDMPRLVKRFPFLFLNHLLSARPKVELSELFEGVRQGIANINLLHTSKHFPKERWPLLWQAEPDTERLESQP